MTKISTTPKKDYDLLCEEGKQLLTEYTIAVFSLDQVGNDQHINAWKKHKKSCEQCRKIMEGKE